jgi:hypothetical protein
MTSVPSSWLWRRSDEVGVYVTLTMMGCRVCGKPADKEVPKNERMGVCVWWRSRRPFGVIVLVEMREKYKKSPTGGGKSCYNWSG